MIGIIGAMSLEINGLLKLMSNKTKKKISGVDFHLGLINGKEVAIAKCGVGKVAAAYCTQAMIMEYKPSLIINTGVAGGIADVLEVEDIVIASDLVQHDLDTTILGDILGMIPGINRIHIPCSKKAIKSFSLCAENLGYPYYVGRIASGDQFISSKEKIKYIADNFHALACEMEGAAIAQVCYMNKVDVIVIRSISDKADEKSLFDFLSFAKRAAKKSINLLLEFLKRQES